MEQSRDRATQTCNVGTFNGGGSGATATVALTGTNTIAAGTALHHDSGGYRIYISPNNGCAYQRNGYL